MNRTDRYGSLLDRLLDPAVEFDDIDLSTVPPEDLIFILQALRGSILLSRGVAQELAVTLSDVVRYVEHSDDRLIVIGGGNNLIH